MNLLRQPLTSSLRLFSSPLATYATRVAAAPAVKSKTAQATTAAPTKTKAAAAAAPKATAASKKSGVDLKTVSAVKKSAKLAAAAPASKPRAKKVAEESVAEKPKKQKAANPDSFKAGTVTKPKPHWTPLPSPASSAYIFFFKEASKELAAKWQALSETDKKVWALQFFVCFVFLLSS